MNPMRTDLDFLRRLLRDGTERRHALRWWRSRQPDFLLKNCLPWLVFDAIDAVVALDLADRRVFEYGSGGSTLFWQAQGAFTVSIEHDPAWFAAVRSRLAGAPTVDYRLIEPEPGARPENGDPSDPDAYLSADARWRDASFHRYVTAIEEFPDGTFDVVLVDGRARPSCIKHGARKVVAGGALILDDSERPYYLARTKEYVQDFVEKRFSGLRPAATEMSTTSIFTKLP